jgi:hypothetical protein
MSCSYLPSPIPHTNLTRQGNLRYDAKRSMTTLRPAHQYCTSLLATPLQTCIRSFIPMTEDYAIRAVLRL